jgi:hypothetical protein
MDPETTIIPFINPTNVLRRSSFFTNFNALLPSMLHNKLLSTPDRDCQIWTDKWQPKQNGVQT